MMEIIHTSIVELIKISPILIIAILISQIISYYIPKNKIKKVSKQNEKNFAKAAGIGLITPGPLLAYLPILKTLKTKGAPLSMIAAFITAQTLIGPARVILELKYFGPLFFIYRVILAFFIALAVATGFKLMEKYV
ncbi:hypothetical protein C0581_03970 [Candidatus Parcubacteria bacterium]|nr:MAG: hypothetical protein C0581_03970 [Candidatus Parcubacteria bacterium]